jgi:hypothetical protein
MTNVTVSDTKIRFTRSAKTVRVQPQPIKKYLQPTELSSMSRAARSSSPCPPILDVDAARSSLRSSLTQSTNPATHLRALTSRAVIEPVSDKRGSNGNFRCREGSANQPFACCLSGVAVHENR